MRYAKLLRYFLNLQAQVQMHRTSLVIAQLEVICVFIAYKLHLKSAASKAVIRQNWLLPTKA